MPLPPASATESYLELLKGALTASLYDESAWIYIDDPPPPSAAQWTSPMKLLGDCAEYLALRTLRRRSVRGARVRPFDAAVRNEGRDWPCFGYTMIGHRRLDNVLACARDVIQRSVPGDFLEAGVWRGGATIFMRAILHAYGVTDRVVWVADSFSGLPVPENDQDGADFSGVDILKVSLDQVRNNFRRFGLLDAQVEFLPGWFRDTLPSAPIDRLAILRLDGDLYHSTMDPLRLLYDKVSPGGYVIVDDYYSWPSCRRAVDDFLSERSLQPKIETIDWAGAYWQVAAE